MATFETLIFIPEGSLLNEKLAEKTALRQTLKHYGLDWGPAERLRYTSLEKEFKNLSSDDQIDLALSTFLKEDLSKTQTVFDDAMKDQTRLVKGAIDFIDEVSGKLHLILLAKEKRTQIEPRLAPTELLSSFDTAYFADDFTDKLPSKNIFFKILKDNPDIDPDTVLVIGTNLDEEIQGAENANLKSLWLAPKKDKIPISPHPTLHLSKLADLSFYLDLM
ncbi:MAG: HAD hydrolase-like protein [Lactobacillus crispatus]|jgi:2-haloacid dehalogenase|uniref:HAD family hydrolase n=1 Tax=Lactobacillus crispatus TaxID=47770 RepID=UPI0018AA901B|nr:HAD hydrolase-like protein [Lactobacillus crispatus]MCH4003942.1 HAD hydrolase-like protein [Lactobacillus crispatus]MCI1336097.1 HAD hydrolase-like protein [Lactobacillus crispatus]MCI1365587.1 HAD hydrolase-like protein [Lactobacillus crispatus]MCI1494246.1 HAD hydrolase-like protein [Lactobacillus crispatus]MCI1524905.1 HAD hydrolase-like protein [Lactobacillus crispatus]